MRGDFEHPKPRTLVVGHVDHGKTTLTAAITALAAVRNPSVEVIVMESPESPFSHDDAPTIPACFAPFEDGPRRGKSGKNKATRLHPLPPRRL